MPSSRSPRELLALLTNAEARAAEGEAVEIVVPAAVWKAACDVADEAPDLTVDSPELLLVRAEALFLGLDRLVGLPTQRRLSFPFNAAWVLEIALKSHLSSRGSPRDQLRAYSHDLKKLWRKSVQAGLPIPPAMPHWAATLHTLHWKLHLRYDTDITGWVLPNELDTLFGLRMVMSAVEHVVRPK